MSLLLILSLLLCAVITTTNSNQRIVGDFEAYAGQFPYQVSIRTVLIGTHFCGGSIINNQWILTSALCTIPSPSSIIRVVVGSIYLNSGGTTYKILLRVKHPDHNDEENYTVNDIALMQIDGQFVYSDLVQPVKLSSQANLIGLSFMVPGWGWKRNIHDTDNSNTLQYITLKSISIRDCLKWFPDPVDPDEPASQLYDTQICTYSSTGQGICGNDFGNPLVYNGEQYGIVSFSTICGSGYPDIHTKVASFRDWIKEISNV